MKVLCVTILVVLFYQANIARSERSRSLKESVPRLMPETTTKPETPDFDSEAYLSSPAVNQLIRYAETHPNDTTALAQNGVGIIYPTLTCSHKIGTHGPLLFDQFLFEKLQRFVRERIPERTTHAKGVGARGYFKVTNDISMYTKAAFLQLGKETKVIARFSTSAGELGSPDTTVDAKGFAVKCYTEEGIHDFLALNTIAFSTRDPMRFVDSTRSRRKNPQTNIYDLTMATDFEAEQPEMALFLMNMLSSQGVPKSYAYMRGYGLNTYTMVNEEGRPVYFRFLWIPNQKEEFYNMEEAIKLRGTKPNILTQDLFDRIEKKMYPEWTLYFQIMTLKQAAKLKYNPFDPTKLWKIEEYPLIPVGVMTLNKNPINYFAEVEQVAFSPANMVPGIEPSQDIVLQARMFIYPIANEHRVGDNQYGIPVNNCPFAKTYVKDGRLYAGKKGGDSPNYYPNKYHGLNSNDNREYRQAPYFVSGYTNRNDNIDEDNFSHAQYYWDNITPDERAIITSNMVHVFRMAEKNAQMRILDNLVYKINSKLGDDVKAGLKL